MKLSYQNTALRSVKPEEQRLYDHLLYCVRSDTPERLIDRFRHLFFEGRDYVDSDVQEALWKIISSQDANQEFKFVLNRCYYIISYYWQTQEHYQVYLTELVSLLNSSPRQLVRYSRHAQKLKSLINKFHQTEQYLTLERLVKVVNYNHNNTNNDANIIGNLIGRYPYLYEHNLLGEDSSYEQQKTIRHLQSAIRKRFEFNLSQYVTYQVRLAEIARQRQWTTGAGKIIQPIQNPTLLREKALASALKQFMGSWLGGQTYREAAQSFMIHNHQVSSYLLFKQKLYQYLIHSLDSPYIQKYFRERLNDYLKNILPEHNRHKNNEVLILRTCTKLLDFLVVESHKHPQHYLYVDLVTHLGVTETIGLLLKIVLLCPKTKPHLEKKMTILFNHYESSRLEEAPWLIKSLENLNLAFSIYFGAADLSYLKRIM